MVIRTNFNTTKGSLVKTILFPKPNRLNLYVDSLKFVGIMGLIAMIGYFSIVHDLIGNVTTGEVIRRFFDLITITVPPALPAAMSMGVMFALRRLKRNQVYCISPPRVNLAGKISRIVFDKTGTLTEEGLNVSGHRVMKTNYVFYPIVENTKQLFEKEELFWSSSEIYEKIKDTHRLKYLE